MAKAVAVKCRFKYCLRMVGPVRQRTSDLCYTCDRNLEDWSNRERDRLFEWRRRVNMFAERLDTIGGTPERKVMQFIRSEIKKRLEQ